MSRQNAMAALVGAAVVVVVTGAVVLFDPFDGGEPIAGSTTITSTSEGTTSTTEPVTTTTSADTTASTTTTISPVITWDDGRYRVVGVASDDVLNVRGNPGASNPVVGTLPPDGLVQLDGYAAVKSGAEWRSVVLEDGTRGWVNDTFLAPPSGWDVPFEGLPCRPDGTDYGGTQVVDGSGLREGAGNALDVFTYHAEECDRVVIVLGSGEGLTGAGWSSVPASSGPAGTTVTSGGPVIEVRIPGILEARPVTQTVDWKSGFFLATRDMPLAQSRSDLIFRIFFDSNRRAAVHYLDNPARVIIDIRSAPTGTGLDVAAKRGGLAVVMPIQVDLNGPGVTLPIKVNGWARPFEAQGAAILRKAAAEPGTGELVEATFSGTDFLGTQTTSTYSYSTADYTEAWGAFSFVIEDLTPGTYDLFVGDFNEETGEPVGAHQTFTVGG
ncbi:MAG: SH3 domain-containing protein [Acidimicrobiia bacterium]